METTRGYGDTEKPQDYLDSFVAYVNENKDRIEAIRIACTRPSDMTRAQLRELKLELDKENFTESSLNEAASAMSNERIVADIIAFVRRAVLKTPLVNHDARVKMAFSKLISAHHFNKMQLDLLEKIKVYMLHESILNTETFEAPAFKMDGGFAHFNKKFVGQLAEIIREINRQGITVLLIEQNANMALKIADWAYVMQTGSILMQGPGEELAANEEVKAAYLGTAK